MKNNKKIIIGIFVATVICAALTANELKFAFKNSAADRGAIVILTSFADAQTAVFTESKTYTQDPAKLGFEVTTPGYEAFLQKENLSEEDLKALPISALPYASEAGYRILLKVQNSKDQKNDFWIIDEKKQAQKLKI